MTEQRRIKDLCRGLCVLLLCLLVNTAVAQEETLYVVSSVEVDTTAENAVVAREQALQSAQTKAFHILTRRLLSAEDLSTFTMPPADIVAAMIRNFEIESEQRSGVRYLAKLTYSFEPELVQRYFSEGGLSFSDVKRKPILILPFYQTEEETVLWEEANQWREAWSVSNASDGLVPVVVPLGDIDDINLVPDASALTKTKSEMAPLIQRYNADNVMVAIAKPSGEGLKVYLYEYIVEDLQHTRTISVEPNEGEEIYRRAVVSVMSQIQQDWKTVTAADPVSENELIAVVRFGSVQDWVQIQGELEEIPLISDFNVLSLTPSNAQVNIHFRGDEGRLRLALAQRDLSLSQPLVAFDPAVLDAGATSGPIITYELELRTP